jgi:AcrR family transcriptional regulator
MPRTIANNDLRRSVKWRQRRQAIVDVSAKVFAQRGYHATSTVELCDANELGKGALYYYIGSKEKLLVAIHDRVMDEVMLGADRVALAGGSPPEQLAMLGEELLDVIFRYPDHVWVFLHDFPALTGDNAASFRKRRRLYERRVEAVFEEGSNSGQFRPVDPRLAARAWLGMHNYTYLWLKAGGRLSVNEVARSFADIFVRGVASSPGTAPRFAAEEEEDSGGPRSVVEFGGGVRA